MKKIDEHYICKALTEHETWITQIQEKICRMYEFTTASGRVQEDAIQAATYHADRGESNDLTDVLVRYQEILQQQIKEAAICIRELVEELESIYRIIACYNLLDTIGYRVLEVMYWKKGQSSYFQCLLTLEKELNLSETSIKRKRKAALQKILELYNSSFVQTLSADGK